MNKKEQCLDFLSPFLNNEFCKMQTANLTITFKIKHLINLTDEYTESIVYNTINGCNQIIDFINDFDDNLTISTMKRHLNANIETDDASIYDIIVEGDKSLIESIQNVPSYIFDNTDTIDDLKSMK